MYISYMLHICTYTGCSSSSSCLMAPLAVYDVYIYVCICIHIYVHACHIFFSFVWCHCLLSIRMPDSSNESSSLKCFKQPQHDDCISGERRQQGGQQGRGRGGGASLVQPTRPNGGLDELHQGAFNLLEDSCWYIINCVVQIRQWCESNGFTEHGPYGGNSSEGSGGEEDY